MAWKGQGLISSPVLLILKSLQPQALWVEVWGITAGGTACKLSSGESVPGATGLAGSFPG